MKSILVSKFGGPEVLTVEDVPVPKPSAGEVLVKVSACGMNYADIMQREGLYPNGPKPPFGAGFEVSGIVESVGDGVTGLKQGDAVMGFCENGYSEYIVSDANRMMPVPKGLDIKQASAIPCQYLTAYHALRTLGDLTEGQTVLLQAAAGGLGTVMVQIARNIGATVIGTCSTDEKCELIAGLGCHHPINYAKRDFLQEVKRITGNKGCELVVETVGGDVFDKSMKCIKPRGRLITLGVASRQPATVNAINLLANNLTVSGFHLMAYMTDTEAMKNAMRDLYTWLGDGTLRIIVKHEFPLEQATEAQQFISDRKSVGKVVLIP
ncbi:MAG: NADPH:quinone oxidoreductase family protein [Candidatus Hydrogenedentes bacterium]|nr:NADPH:quinone oxidoreductase family protein [Candidatus Hydrogenedentota bacterium]